MDVSQEIADIKREVIKVSQTNGNPLRAKSDMIKLLHRLLEIITQLNTLLEAIENAKPEHRAD